MKTLIVILLLCATFSRGEVKNGSIAMNAPKKIQDIIAIIEANSGDFYSIQMLIYVNEFNMLSEKGGSNIDNCIEFLSGRHSYMQKSIAICSMHKLPLSDYLVFLRKLYGLFEKKLITTELLGLAVAPGNAFSIAKAIIENYKRNDVRGILLEIYNNKNVAQYVKDTIRHILSGKAYSDNKTFFKGQSPS
jgi:hypothetical protein